MRFGLDQWPADVGAGRGDGPMPNLFSIIYFTCGATRRGLGPDRGINVNWDLS